MRNIARWSFALLVLSGNSSAAQTVGVGPRVTVASTTLALGDDPRITLRGRAGDTLTLRARRRAIVARGDSANARRDTVAFESWGRWIVPRGGVVTVSQMAPIAGTWRRADALAVFWSMSRPVDPVNAQVPPAGTLRLDLESRGKTLDSVSITLRVIQRGLREVSVAEPGVVGAYAAPTDGGRRPAILLLHGSEGGDTTSARQLARRFAERGFAAFAIVYVGYPYVQSYAGVPSAFANVPIELLDGARAWMGKQPDADTSRTVLWGASKGAEFALVAASRRTWPAAVVACVPSDVVWSGFGAPAPEGAVLSSWSDAGTPLPAIAYDRYEEVFSGRASARQVHDRSRSASPDAGRLARIPVEAIRAPLLLLGSDADDVWASGPMARQIKSTMSSAGRGAQVTLETYPAAAHGICGDGTIAWPRYAPLDTATARATAEGNARAWEATRRFLKRVVGSPR